MTGRQVGGDGAGGKLSERFSPRKQACLEGAPVLNEAVGVAYSFVV